MTGVGWIGTGPSPLLRRKVELASNGIISTFSSERREKRIRAISNLEKKCRNQGGLNADPLFFSFPKNQKTLQS